MKSRLILICFIFLHGCGEKSAPIPDKVSAIPQKAAEIVADMDWYAEANDPLEHKCTKSDQGPGVFFDTVKKYMDPGATISDEEVVGDIPVKVKVHMPSKGGSIIYMRGKERCEAEMKRKYDQEEAIRNRYK